MQRHDILPLHRLLMPGLSRMFAPITSLTRLLQLQQLVCWKRKQTKVKNTWHLAFYSWVLGEPQLSFIYLFIFNFTCKLVIRKSKNCILHWKVKEFNNIVITLKSNFSQVQLNSCQTTTRSAMGCSGWEAEDTRSAVQHKKNKLFNTSLCWVSSVVFFLL